MSTNLLEKVTSELEGEFYILPVRVGSQKRQTFGEYVHAELNRLGLTPFKAEQKSKEEAEKRGLDPKEHGISDATIGNIISDTPPNLQMNKLLALSWVINQPIEVVAAKAFGFESRLSDFQRSDVAKIWELQQRLAGEIAGYYEKRIADLKREMDSAVAQAKKAKR